MCQLKIHYFTLQCNWPIGVEGGPLQSILRQLWRERTAIPDQRWKGEPYGAGLCGDESVDSATEKHDGQAARGAEAAAVGVVPGKGALVGEAE